MSNYTHHLSLDFSVESSAADGKELTDEEILSALECAVEVMKESSGDGSIKQSVNHDGVTRTEDLISYEDLDSIVSDED